MVLEVVAVAKVLVVANARADVVVPKRDRASNEKVYPKTIA
jgi:hypothetical protein